MRGSKGGGAGEVNVRVVRGMCGARSGSVSVVLLWESLSEEEREENKPSLRSRRGTTTTPQRRCFLIVRRLS
jgi:hypothetical protein